MDRFFRMIRSLFASVLAFFSFLIIHFSYFHFFTPYEKTHALLCIASIGLLTMLGFLLVFPSEIWFQEKLSLSDVKMQRWIYPLIGILFYGFLFLGYLEFYFTADRSITFRMLMIIDKQPGYEIEPDKMFQLYNVPEIINKRFDDLEYGGYLTIEENKKYKLTRKGKVILNIYRFAIDFLRLNTQEKKSEN